MISADFGKPPKGTSCLSFGNPWRFAKAKGKKVIQEHKN
jgi:hypothetical protein